MRKTADPLLAIAIAAAIVGAAWIVMVSAGPDTPSLLWNDKDFANYWVAARLALEGRVHDVFGPHAAYLAHLRSLFGPDYPWRAWSYPPHYLLLMLPLGLLPYKTALVVFLLVTFLLLCVAVRTISRQPRPWQLLLLLPVIATNGFSTQNGFLLSAFMLAGLALRDTRPVLAGICFGLMTVKPQLGLLLPLLFLWERQWRTIASACVTALVLVVLSILVFGIEAWTGYVSNTVPYQTYVMKEIGGLFINMMPTVFGSARSLDFDASIAFAVHLPFGVAVLALYGISLVRLDRPETRAASTLFATTLAVPYLLNYDLIALVASAVLLTDRGPASPAWRWAVIGLAFMPMLMPLLGIFGWPITPVVILMAWLVLLGREGVLPHLRRRSIPAKA